MITQHSIMKLAQPISVLFCLSIILVKSSPIDLDDINFDEGHNMKKRDIDGLGHGHLLRSFGLGSGNLLRSFDLGSGNLLRF